MGGRKKAHPFYGSPAWKRTRAQVLKRDRHRCVNCNVDVRGKGQSRVDHIQPRTKRPDLAFQMSNLRTLCIKCDNLRHINDRHGGKNKDAPKCQPNGLPHGW